MYYLRSSFRKFLVDLRNDIDYVLEVDNKGSEHPFFATSLNHYFYKFLSKVWCSDSSSVLYKKL